jgi:hypothetical protein
MGGLDTKAGGLGQHVGTFEIKNLKQLFRELEKVADFHKTAAKDIRKVHREAGKELKKSVRGSITNAKQTIHVKRTGRYGGQKGPSYTIKPGSLKRSILVFRAKGSQTSMLVGPRSQIIFQKRKLQAITKDGYFAHIVDMGRTIRGNTYNGPNKGFWMRGIAKGTPAAKMKLESGYKSLWDKFLTTKVKGK